MKKKSGALLSEQHFCVYQYMKQLTKIVVNVFVTTCISTINICININTMINMKQNSMLHYIKRSQ